MSDADERYLVLFMDRYNEQAAKEGLQHILWDELPLSIRESIAAALAAVVHQVTEELF